MTSNRPAWTISEAAERCGVSRSTVRRYRENGKFPNAFTDKSNAWKIPLEDLLSVGWNPAEPPGEPTVSVPTERPSNAAAERVRELEQALYQERARADSAEQLAATYRENVQDLRLALRMLEGRVVSSPERPAEPVLSKVTEQSAHAHSVASEQPLSSPEQPSSDREKGRRQPVLKRRWWFPW